MTDFKMAKTLSVEKQSALSLFKNHVSAGKARFFRKYHMDFVMGNRDKSIICDMDDDHYLINLHCNGGVFNLGHRNPVIIQELKNALDKIDIGNHHLMSQYRAGLAKELSELMPGDLDVTIFGVSGGEAVDLAIKTARSFTSRNEIISLVGGYHGHTGLALSAGDSEYIEPFGKRLPHFVQVPFADLEALRQTINSDTAAVILETIPATAGILVPTKSYMQGVREICDSAGVLLILDEVQTGLGRTGKLWAFEHFDIIPDIVVLGKGLSGGIYPITATVLRKPLEKVFEAHPFSHISTFGGSELGCCVASKVLQISSSPEFKNHVDKLSSTFQDELSKLKAKYPHFLVDIRQLGLMIGLVLKNQSAGPALTKAAYDNGLLIIYANNDPSVCQFLPPLNLDPDKVPEIISKLDKSLNTARKLAFALEIKNKWKG
ncbi:MAG: aspartate aminotransferase family protein [Fidelibacterota bacterium]